MDPEDPELIYQRRWAHTLLDRCMERLQNVPHFDHLKEFLAGDASRGGYARVAEELGVTEGALRVSVHRLRARYRRELEAEIASTVASPAEVADEIRFLLGVL